MHADKTGNAAILAARAPPTPPHPTPPPPSFPGPQVNEAARRPRARLSFALVYPDRRGVNVMRQVGVVMAGRPGADDARALQELSFQTGDLLSVALL